MSNNILVIKLDKVGEFIMALGAMQAIRKHHKDDKITLLTTDYFVDIAERSRLFDEIVVAENPSFFNISGWIDLAKFFNRGKYFRVYDLQNEDRTNFYHKLFFKKPEWAGVVKSNKLYCKRDDWDKIHIYTRYKEILKAAGINELPLPDISWMKTDISILLEMHKVKKPYVMFVPGSNPAFPDKRWPAVRFGGLALKLFRDGYDVVVVGRDGDEDAIDKIKKACPKVKDLSEQTSLYDIYSLAEESSGIVGNDTSPCHIASLTNKPLVSLFCSKISNPSISAPIGQNVKGVEADNIANIPVNSVYNIFKPLRHEKEVKSDITSEVQNLK